MHFNILFFFGIISSLVYANAQPNKYSEFSNSSYAYNFSMQPAYTYPSDSLTDHIRFNIRVIEEPWHDYQQFIVNDNKNERPKNDSHYKGIPTVLIPMAFVGESIGDAMEWLGETCVGNFFSSIFETQEYPPLDKSQQHATAILHANNKPNQLLDQAMQEQQTFFSDYKQYLHAYADEIRDLPYPDIYNRNQKRINSFQAYEINTAYYEKEYELPTAIVPYLTDHSINAQPFERCYGNVIQQELHQEIIEIISTNYTIHQLYKQYEQTPLFADLVLEGADLARELNSQGNVKKGFAIADYCGWLNEAEYPLIASAVKQAAGFAVGTVEGAYNIIKNTYALVKAIKAGIDNPRTKGKDIVTTVGYATKFLIEALGEAGSFAFHLSFHGTPRGYQLHENFARNLSIMRDILSTSLEEVHNLPPEEQARALMAFYTELCFSGKAMSFLGKTVATHAQLGKKGAITLTHKMQLYKCKALIETYQRTNKLVINGKSYIQYKVQRIIKPLLEPREIIALEETAAGTRYIIDAESALIERIPATSCNQIPIPHGNSLQSIPTKIIQKSNSKRYDSLLQVIRYAQKNPTRSMPSYAQKMLCRMQKYVSLAEELPMLRKSFDQTCKGWGKMKNKWLKFNYEHIFEANTEGNRLNGLHHDYLGFYENNNILQLEKRIVGKFGEYGGIPRWQYSVGGYKKTYFPQHWTRKQVMHNIQEAYNDFLATKMEPIQKADGKFNIIGKTNAGMNINMIIDQKLNLISAFPVI